MTTEETQIVELLNSRIKANLDLAGTLLKGLKTTQKAFFQKIGWSVSELKK